MKIGILSLYYKNHNYGGQLQAYALCSYLNSKDSIECEQVSYNYKCNQIKKIGLKQKLFSMYVKTIQNSVVKGLAQRTRKFEEFEHSIPHSKEYDSLTIDECNSLYDLIIAGSDQVWNTQYTDDTYFLTRFDKEKRCSYAASFGRNNLKELHGSKYIQYLKEFSFLTVREENAQTFLKEEGIEDCHIVCDPTMLLSTTFWEKQAIIPEVGSDDLFVYLLGDSEENRKKIRAFANRHNLKIVYIPHVHFCYQKKDAGFADYEVFDAGPREFLGLIKNAKFIITDSFHCCLFSVLFQKSFWAIDRGGKINLNNRIISLLNVVGLQERLVNDLDVMGLNQINSYSHIFDKIEVYRQQSISLLDSMLKQRMNQIK